jgi:subtilisin family serine protease
MRSFGYFIIISLLVLVGGCEKSDNIIAPTNNQETFSKAAQNNVVGRYIVVLKDNVSRVPDVASEMAKQNTAEVGFVYSHSIKGFSAQMSKSSADKLGEDSRVKYIVEDKLITLSPGENGGKKHNGGSPTQDPAQVTPWGITRVGGPGDGTGKTVWIIDTGVDLSNKDLNVDFTRSANFVPRGKDSPNDGNGHGTHVAGTIAALNNNIDVVGVAAGATVVAVRVLDNSGSGYASWVIAGIDYVAANGNTGDVANMSLGGSSYKPLDDAVLGASTKVKFTIAAGNSGDYAGNYSPAEVDGNNIYTVSAFGDGDVWAYWSNYGYPSPVDYSGPGVNILSLKAGGGTTTMSGTSMATPHLAGLLLLGNISTSGHVTDSQNVSEPIAHR